ncbi:MAG: hypothetical protein QM831_24185 [Kofleriaceae bacterium]
MWWVVASALLAGCGTSAVQACLDADHSEVLVSDHVCEVAYQRTFDPRTVGAGSHLALRASDEVRLFKWLARAGDDVEGARAMHFVAQEELDRGKTKLAEQLLRRALKVRMLLDPMRAANTALLLFDIVRSNEPAEESIRLVQIAWEQAEVAKASSIKTFAASGAVDLLLDLGEVETAEKIAGSMDRTAFPEIADLADGRIAAAHGRYGLASTLLDRAIRAKDNWSSTAVAELADVLIDANKLDAAKEVLSRPRSPVEMAPSVFVDAECRVSAVNARLAQVLGSPSDALSSADAALATGCRDTARASVLQAKASALARLDRLDEAEAAWSEAASSIRKLARIDTVVGASSRCSRASSSVTRALARCCGHQRRR